LAVTDVTTKLKGRAVQRPLEGQVSAQSIKWGTWKLRVEAILWECAIARSRAKLKNARAA